MKTIGTAKCLQCGATAPILENLIVVTFLHENDCPFMKAYERGKADKFIRNNGHPIKHEMHDPNAKILHVTIAPKTPDPEDN